MRTLTQPDPDASGKRAGGLFNDKEPIRGLAETFAYTNTSGKAIYTGTAAALARVFQGRSEVLGDDIRLDDASQNLDATGHVSTTFEMTVQSGRIDDGQADGIPCHCHRVSLRRREAHGHLRRQGRARS